MIDLLALITIILWPVIPLFWIPVHGLSRIFKRLGLLTYAIPLISWLPFAYFIYSIRNFILPFKIELPFLLNISGIPLLILGTLLHLWTGKLLGLWGLIGLPEVSARIKGKLITEVAAVGIITILDFFFIHVFIIPLEEKELLNRLGEGYRLYRERVPKFFPHIHR